ncbi:TRM11 family SAM-dependent methyltransferase [Metabacillus sp. 113a]|uniref:TRM11 family SAM-dependent methyltransferase n=1 Tax=Metabacillus sp. 113a TaxID=3404706 RepID=UPI003CFB9378
MEMRSSESFVYAYTYSKEEHSLCMLELRSLFGEEVPEGLFLSGKDIPAGRSPFIREKVGVFFEAETLTEISAQLGQLKLGNETFKIICLKSSELPEGGAIDYKERRLIERELGQYIEGEADVHHPDRMYGIAALNGKWYFGSYDRSEAVWLQHIKKPRQYSTALSTRLARAVVNIAVPDPKGVSVIDPCCGIGNILVEALSMGVQISGRDINPLAVTGARENIAYFGLIGEVAVGPIEEVTARYDTAVIDLPYNLYTHITHEEQESIIQSARRIADRCVFVTIDPIDRELTNAGFKVIDRGFAVKSRFKREIVVCI